jgi:hypothetical protein
MKQITLNIPDGKFDFFMEVFKRLGLEIAKKNVSIPEWQQDQTIKRMQELDKDPSKAIDFDDMLNRLEEKHGL